MDILCITLPKASRTAWEVKFSEGMRLMKCFCLVFSYVFPTVSADMPYGSIFGAQVCVLGSYRWAWAGSYLFDNVVDGGVGLLKLGCQQLLLVESVKERLRLYATAMGAAMRTCCWPSKLLVEINRLTPPAQGTDAAFGRKREARAVPRNAGSDMAPV